jgi:hypothetical protein
VDAKLNDLPQDREALEAILRALILERDQQSQRAEQESKRANDLQGETLRQRKRADELHLENLRLQLELQRLNQPRLLFRFPNRFNVRFQVVHERIEMSRQYLDQRDARDSPLGVLILCNCRGH